MADVVPFLKAVAGASSRPLGSSLPQIATEPAMSPWSPKPTAPVVEVVVAPTIDVEAITAAALEAGRAEGMRETEALRAKLAQVIDALETLKRDFTSPATELIADAASAVVEGWLGSADRKAVFAPLVAAWITSGSTGATARCHPSDVDAVRAAVGETAITVTADPDIAPGDLMIADATRELAHAWEPRLRELREAIAGALVEP